MTNDVITVAIDMRGNFHAGVNTKWYSVLFDHKLTKLFSIEHFSGVKHAGKALIIIILLLLLLLLLLLSLLLLLLLLLLFYFSCYVCLTTKI